MVHTLVLVTASVVLQASVAQDPAPTAPRLTAPAPAADAPEGHFLVTWDSSADPASDTEFELAYSSNPDFAGAISARVGVDRATFLSGLAPGTTYVRVRAIQQGTASAWSEVGAIVVVYPKAATVRALMILGGLTGILLLVAIVLGHIRTRSTGKTAGEA